MIGKLLTGGAVVLALSVDAGHALAQQASTNADVRASAPASSSTSTGVSVSAPSGDVSHAPAGTAHKTRRASGNPVTSTLGGVPGLIGSTVGGGFSLAGSTIGGALGLGHSRRAPPSSP